MIRKILRKNKIKNVNFFVEPDEIFLDSKNISNFNQQQFEGRIEKPIPKKTVLFLGIFLLIFGISFTARLSYLQIHKGEAYFTRSENNTLEKQVVFADRGIIYDRNKKELAWNEKLDNINTDTKDANQLPIRDYLSDGFAHLLGYISYPAQDKSGVYWQTKFIGKDGLEKQYNEKLEGINGSKIVETYVNGKVQSENIIDSPKQGDDLTTTIDSRIQTQLFKFIKNLSLSQNNLFQGGAGLIMDISNGEILTSTSFPEYNSKIISLGKDAKTINSYMTNKGNVFLDKNISGLYTPGSIIKPFVAMGVLNEKVIDPATKILSTGSISIPNPYFPNQESVFKDWRPQGWVDMEHALSVSSDVYFYEVGGGYQNQKGLGIAGIEKYTKLFGIGSKTSVDLPDENSGVIPSPEWKAQNFKGDPWRIGDTYHTAIGQYGFQVTPLEMVRAVGAIANNGTLVTPHFILGDTKKEKETTNIGLNKGDFAVVQQGMRLCVTEGTCTAVNVPYVQIASKTGTAQLGVNKNKVNSWIIGFFPYDHPRYAFVIMMEAGPAANIVGASSVARQLFDWMSTNTPEYFK